MNVCVSVRGRYPAFTRPSAAQAVRTFVCLSVSSFCAADLSAERLLSARGTYVRPSDPPPTHTQHTKLYIFCSV